MSYPYTDIFYLPLKSNIVGKQNKRRYLSFELYVKQVLIFPHASHCRWKISWGLNNGVTLLLVSKEEDFCTDKRIQNQFQILCEEHFYETKCYVKEFAYYEVTSFPFTGNWNKFPISH